MLIRRFSEANNMEEERMRLSRPAVYVGTSLIVLLQLAGTALAQSDGRWGESHHLWGHAPEMDPSLIGSGLALLGGSFLLFIERCRRRK
jgi:hypothetical protein